MHANRGVQEERGMSVGIIFLGLLCGLIFLATGAGAWWVHRQARQAGESELAWFDAVAVSSDFFSFPTPTSLSTAHLLDSLGAGDDQRSVLAAQRLMPGPLGSVRQTTLGIAAELAGRMNCAAAACGILVVPNDSAPGEDSLKDAGAPASVSIAGPTPWLLGMDVSGNSVSVHPVPGSTILVLGNLAPPPKHHWFRLLKTDSVGMNHADSLVEAWKHAWDPSVCRVVAPKGIADDKDARLEGIHFDVLIHLGSAHGELIGEVHQPAAGFSRRFWPLFAAPQATQPPHIVSNPLLGLQHTRD